MLPIMPRHLGVVAHVVLVSALTFLATACGQYKEKERKDYRLYLDTSNGRVKSETRRLIDRYNSDIGFQAFTVAESSDDDVSPVVFTNHLQDNTGKIGFGQWETSTIQEPTYHEMEMRKLDRTIVYRMNVEFDEAYFEERMDSGEDTTKGQELYILFCHEVGHGFQLEHDPNNHAAIMYPAVEARPDKDFQGYFAEVKAFFAK